MDTALYTEDLFLHPFRQLRDRTAEIRKCLWLSSKRDGFSWVYGLSEVELEEFVGRYTGIKQELQDMICRVDDLRLRQRLQREWDHLPEIILDGLIAPQGSTLASSMWLRPWNKIRQTYRLWRKTNIIVRSAEVMIDAYNSRAWLDIAHPSNQ